MNATPRLSCPRRCLGSDTIDPLQPAVRQALLGSSWTASAQKLVLGRDVSVTWVGMAEHPSDVHHLICAGFMPESFVFSVTHRKTCCHRRLKKPRRYSTTLTYGTWYSPLYLQQTFQTLLAAAESIGLVQSVLRIEGLRLAEFLLKIFIAVSSTCTMQY